MASDPPETSADSGAGRERTALLSESLTEGAAGGAPTAPHATPREKKGKSTGPERFWSRWRLRVVLGFAFTLSLFVHLVCSPLGLIPTGMEFKEREGIATIPIDFFDEDEAPTSSPNAQDNVEGPEGAGGVRSGSRDGSVDGAIPDAAPDVLDAGPDVEDAAAEAGPEAGPAAGPRDPLALLRAQGAVQSDKPLVTLIINNQMIRKHPIGPHIGPMLLSIRQWQLFFDGSGIDPVQQLDVITLNGPSLSDTSKDVVSIQYSATDAAIEAAVIKVARDGPYDVKQPTVRAWKGNIDGSERVFLRPSYSGILHIVPKDAAERVAAQVAVTAVKKNWGAEGIVMRAQDPHGSIPQVPAEITTLYIRVTPRADEGVDLVIEGDCANAAKCAIAAEGLDDLVGMASNPLTGMVASGAAGFSLSGLFDTFAVTSKERSVRATITLTREQVERIVSGIARKNNLKF